MAVAVPDDFDEESIWGHCLRHKLAADDGDLRKLIFALSEADASALQRCSAQTTESFVRTLSGMLKAEPWLQAEACSIFAGMCRMDKSKFADIINKDWFVISILRMLREPPEEQTLTTILGVIRDVVADSSSRPENIAWMCTPSVIDICLSMVDSPFHDSCLALVELMVRPAAPPPASTGVPDLPTLPFVDDGVHPARRGGVRVVRPARDAARQRPLLRRDHAAHHERVRGRRRVAPTGQVRPPAGPPRAVAGSQAVLTHRAPLLYAAIARR